MAFMCVLCLLCEKKGVGLDHVLCCTACCIDRKRVVVKAGGVNLCGPATPWVRLDRVRYSFVRCSRR